jgi:formate dehydrogenase major subunit
VGWTQHTSGVQLIRTATLVQLLLGNIGRPGGGILALRGHATIQGSTDIATLYNIHPGYLNTPSVQRKHDTLKDYIATEVTPTAFWSNFPKFIVSQLKAWYGDAATPENQFGYDWLPKITGDHSHMPMFVEISKGTVRACSPWAEPGGGRAARWLPAPGLSKAGLAGGARPVRDRDGEFLEQPGSQERCTHNCRYQTEVFFLPAAAVPEMDGSFTNTQRLVQWHDKAVDPPGDARSDIWFTVHLGRRLKQLYAASTNPRDQGFNALTWDYIDAVENAEWRLKDEPSAQRILKEINGFNWGDKKPLASFAQLKDDGSTACGAWIYTGIYAPTPEHPAGLNRARSRTPDDWVALEWGFAWPANRRIMYNRAAADPSGNPWPKEARLAQQLSGGKFKGYVYFDPQAEAGKDAQGNPLLGKWVGLDIPDFPPTKKPNAPARPNGVGLDFHDGASPFIMKGDGKAWLFAPSGLVDGPLPAHYEPYESPVQNFVYKQQTNPLAKVWEPKEMLAAVGSKEYPHILSTYRLTEHHLSGSMSRWLPWLAELQPELFVEISPEHAAELGIHNTELVQISTPRGSSGQGAGHQAGATVHRQLSSTMWGCPHWGYKGIAVGL